MQSILLSEIDSYLVDVSEEISIKHLQDFLFYQLSQKSLILDTTSKVFYAYLQESKQYFVAHFKTSNEIFVIEPYILKAYYLNQKTSNKDVDLFITEEYFALYKNQKLFFFKSTLQKVSKVEIETYVEKSLHINITNCISLDKKQVELLKNTFKSHYKNIEKLSIIKNNEFKHIKQFTLFLTLCIMVLVGGFAYETFYEKRIAPIKSEQVAVFPMVQSQTLKLILVIESINDLMLELVSLQLNDSVLSLSLKHSNKDKLIEFLTQYQCEVKTLQYNKKENLYELSAIFQLS